MWDAWDNAGIWIYKAVTTGFNPFLFDHGGHPSMVYFFILGISQYVDLGNQYLLHLTNAILTILSIIAFYGILKKLFAKEQNNIEILAFTFLYAFFPIITANSLHINPDYGVMIFYIIFLNFLLREKVFWAILAACAMVFSKEPGIAIYTLTIVLYLIILKKKLKKGIVFLIPFLLFSFWYLCKKYILFEKTLWIGAKSIFGANDLTAWPWWNIDKIPLSYFLGIFVINFNWILTIIILLGLIKYFLSWKVRQREERGRIGFFILEFLGVVFIVTFFKTFTNLRYFLPVYPLMIILTYFCLSEIIRSRILRQGIITGLIILFFSANFSTFDPVSKKIYGIFKFGSHEMLKMTSISNECCGYGRDQLVYNFEYLNIAKLLDKIFMDLKPSKETAFAYQLMGGPLIFPKIDNVTHLRTLRSQKAFDSRIVNWNIDLFPQKPDKINFIEFPNAEAKGEINKYLDDYEIKSEKLYENRGYKIKVYLLELKQK